MTNSETSAIEGHAYDGNGARGHRRRMDPRLPLPPVPNWRDCAQEGECRLRMTGGRGHTMPSPRKVAFLIC